MSMIECRLQQRGVRYAAIVVSWVLCYASSGHSQSSRPVISPPVTALRVNVDQSALMSGGLPGPSITIPEGETPTSGPPAFPTPVHDSVIQHQEAPVPAGQTLSNPVVNIPGLAVAVNPPDPVGDVGRNHFVQMVNVTFYQIWNKHGDVLTPPLTFGNLWPAGETCRSNAGDPIVVYDHLADRWLLSQFANPSHMCIAISQTPDPTAGTWFLYTFNVGVFPDYPKFGVWSDGYYMSSYEGTNLGVFVFRRDAMLLGEPASFFKTTILSLTPRPGLRETRILPSDLDGPPPETGTPNFFVRTVDDQQDINNPTERIEIYEARVDWAVPSFSFTLTTTLIPAAFNVMVCNRGGGGIRDCIPQPATTATIDALSNRPMMQVKYRNFGSFQAMVFNQTIDVSGSIPGIAPLHEVAGIRWYELRNAGTGWNIHQQGTFAPQRSQPSEDQLLHRWMGSAAIDKNGNIAIGYSVVNGDSSNPVFPGIRYTGRYVHDPLGTLQHERTILDGVNAQTGGLGQRWGDYSTLSVDPVDDCTFWYTTHLAGAGGSGARPTRIASFRFPNCTVP
jgi:hypothetical protein